MRLVESGSTDNDQKYKVRGSDEELALDEKVLFDQTDISSAAAVKNEYGAYVVEFQLTDDAAQRFSDLTERSIGKRLAIIVNGEVITAPVIQMQISGGKGQISAIGDEKEARAIAGKLSGK